MPVSVLSTDLIIQLTQLPLSLCAHCYRSPRLTSSLTYFRRNSARILLWRPCYTSLGNPKTGEKFGMGTEHSHNPIDSKDEQSWKNKIADAERVEKIEKIEEVENALADPTAIAKSHGNEPSKGAKKDKELMHDEEEELRKKDEAKKQSAEAHKDKHHK